MTSTRSRTRSQALKTARKTPSQKSGSKSSKKTSSSKKKATPKPKAATKKKSKSSKSKSSGSSKKSTQPTPPAAATRPALARGRSGKMVCAWAISKSCERYETYHDETWGVPLHDDQKLFEMLMLEGFQAGLSWSTILNKEETFRAAFDGWDATKISKVPY